MICYVASFYNNKQPTYEFQTKLTYGMICYAFVNLQEQPIYKFQTKLTYGMICYFLVALLFLKVLYSFKLS